MKALFSILILLGAVNAFGYQEANVVVVFPWKLCLIVSGALSLGFYLLRGNK